MKNSIILKEDTNSFPVLIVYKSSNSFGGQLLEFVYEYSSGDKRREYEIFPEGSCGDFTKSEMLKLWETIK